MKKLIKLTILAVIVVLMSLALFGCKLINRVFLGGDPYNFSDIVLTQTDINEFKVEFNVNCGKEDVKFYLTEGFRLSDSAKPLEVEKTVNKKNAHVSFTKTFNLGEDYYLWVVKGDKEAKTSIAIPSMFPTISANDDGSATFNFNYTYGTAWGSFCDPTGKAVYKSSKPVFDSSAVLIQDGIDITTETCTVPANMVDANSYYFSVSIAKDGAVKSISRPVSLFGGFVDHITGITSNVTNDLKLELNFDIKKDSSIASQAADKLQIVIKTDTADEIYVLDCNYDDGKASFGFDLTELQFEGLWYDVLIVWDGAIVMDVPQYYGGRSIEISPSVKKDGIIYSTVGWKFDDAPEGSEMLKVYYEKDTTRYADEILSGYLVSFSTEGDVPTLQLRVTLKNGQTEAPVLAITAGDATQLVSAKGTLQDDGSYLYTLDVSGAMTVADIWYDLRFFIGNTPYEMLKDSCIAYADFSDKYVASGRTYEFREWNGILKLMFTETAE